MTHSVQPHVSTYIRPPKSSTTPQLLTLDFSCLVSQADSLKILPSTGYEPWALTAHLIQCTTSLFHPLGIPYPFLPYSLLLFSCPGDRPGLTLPLLSLEVGARCQKLPITGLPFGPSLLYIFTIHLCCRSSLCVGERLLTPSIDLQHLCLWSVISVEITASQSVKSWKH